MGGDERSRSVKKRRQRRERREAFAAVISKAVKRGIGRSTTQETPLHIRARNTSLDEALHDYMRGRTAFKLGKFGLRLTRVTVRIENVAGPKGPPSFSCRFKVVLADLPLAVIAATHSSPRAAFDLAADAAERDVRRLLDRYETLRTRRLANRGG